MSLKTFLIYAIFIIGIAGCTGTKKLPQGTKLYTGAEVKFQTEKNIPKKGELKDEMEAGIRPEPNNVIFGMRPAVWLHNITRDTADDKGIDAWINRNLAKAPVLMEEVNPGSTTDNLRSILFNKGFFGAEVNYEIKDKKNTASVNYLAQVSSPYRIDSLIFPDSTDLITGYLNKACQVSEIEKGDQYELQIVKQERERISDYLRDRGYYFFSPEFIIIDVDTTLADRLLNIYIELKDNIPEKATKKYKLSQVIIKPGYDFEDNGNEPQDTLKINKYGYIATRDEIFNPMVIIDAIFLKPDSIYSSASHQQTQQRLINLNVFQFVNIKYEENESEEEFGSLKTTIQLIPAKRKLIRFELQAVSKSNDYVGPNLRATFQNKNFLGGAELFELNLSGGFETQFSQIADTVSFNSYELGIETSLYIPRFVTPFNIRNTSSHFVPKTRFKLEYRRLNRVSFFELNNFNASMGYIWKETESKRHKLNIIDIGLFTLSNTTDLFRRRKERSTFLQQSFEERFILSTSYSFTLNRRRKDENRNGYYFNGVVDLSGNLMNLLQSSLREKEAEGEPYEIFGTAYSQYSRFLFDTRYYYQIDRTSEVAFRLFIGLGIPYGNSNTLPFTKQFFIGGTNSIRAFPARSLGPGTFNPDSSAGFYDQSGDIRLEGNIEYRFPIYGFIKGALFLDAGNIWLINPTEEKPGAKFEFSNFSSQLAVGTGFGIRLDIDFLVLRLDLGVPLRKPFLERGNRWYFDQLGFDDIVYNIGIGYPF
ncbi:MAG: BamA/TamA family outer membrane protein [Cyclobacteriaceae bacterium]